jgi:protein-L-isoaspartate(D-aspartate) O-methyltransferase
MLMMLLCGTGATSGWAAPGYASERRAMVKEIESDAHYTSLETGRATFSPQVMAVMGKVPRHQFVPRNVREAAYENRPLPIGYGQTISQPYIVALMTDLLEVDKNARVLEVGTGSGYQAAVLAELVDQVYTMEIIQPLGAQATKRLARLGYQNAHVRIGDGYYGWKEHAPYDAIIVTAAASHVPPPLVEQLKPNGKLVIPVGGRFMTQQLMLVQKTQAGSVKTRQMLPVQFVPLTGEH